MSSALATSDLVVLTIVMLVEAPGPGPGTWVFLVTVGLMLGTQGQFRSRITLSLANDLGPVLTSLAVPLLVVSVLGGFGPHVSTALEAGIVAALVMMGARALIYAGIRALRVQRKMTERTLIVGAGSMGARFACTLSDHPEYGLDPVGFLDDLDREPNLPRPLLGRIPHLPSVIVEHRIQRVVIAFGVANEAAMVDIVRACVDASVDVHVLPRFFELGWTPRHGQMDDVWGYPLVRLPRSSWRPAGRLAKRSFDIVVASLALLLLSPLYGALALAVKLSSPGPVYHRQIRVGERSRRVEVLKFRSMSVNGDADVTWDVGDDERVTPVGRWLRDLSLDELPQLWNVVRGDMSLVGPRPERPYFVDRFRTEIEHYERRHRMPGGLTGLAQVHGLRGARTSIVDRARLDNHYVQTWSFWRDVHILVRTPLVVISYAWRHRARAASGRLKPNRRRAPWRQPRAVVRSPNAGRTRSGARVVVRFDAPGRTRVVARPAPGRPDRDKTESDKTERDKRVVTGRRQGSMVPLLVGSHARDADRAPRGGSPAPPT
jgi:exopolysaccharide biosynthesis polyprenyl glycosylphosphotransferase